MAAQELTLREGVVAATHDNNAASPQITNGSFKPPQQSRSSRAITSYDELEYAHKLVVEHLPYKNSWLWGNGQLNPIADIDESSSEAHTTSRDGFGAILSLPRKPEGLNGSNRDLWKAMDNIYRLILSK